MNQQDREFIQHLTDDGSRRFEKLSNEEFLLRNVVVRTKGDYLPYRFDTLPYWREITRICEKAKHVTFLKAAQIYYSTWALGRIAWKLDGTSRKAGIYFPTKTAIKDFRDTRANPFFKYSPYLSRLIDETELNNDRQVTLGKATLIYRGTFTTRDVKSDDLDIIMLDEVDEHNSSNIEFVPDRTSASDLEWLMQGSQPSIPGFGIHAEFLKTSQHYLHFRCPACNTWQSPTLSFLEKQESIFGFDKDGNAYYACAKCGRPLSTKKYEFVARNTNEKDRIGFQISKIPFSKPAPVIYKKWKEANTSVKKKNFWISDLGWPYASDEEQPLQRDFLDTLQGDHGLRDGSEYFTYMGADQGDNVHMVFGEPTSNNRVKIIGLAKMHITQEDLHRQKIERFSVYSGIVDATPNKGWSLKLAMRYPENIKIQYFKNNFNEKSEAIPGQDEGVEVLQINRDDSLQDTVDAVKNGYFIFPDRHRLNKEDSELMEEFLFHLTMLTKERGEDEDGNPLYHFKKKVPNHFGMALNSLRLAIETSGIDTSGSPVEGA